MFKRDETKPLGFSSILVEYYDGLLKLAIRGKQRADGLGGGIGGKAPDEELAERDVAIGYGADGIEDVGVTDCGCLEDIEKLLLCEGFDYLADLFWG